MRAPHRRRRSNAFKKKCKNLLARSLAGNVRRAHSPAAAASCPHGAWTNDRLDRSSPVSLEEEKKVDRRPADDTRLSLQVPQRLLSGPSSTALPSLVLARQRSHAPSQSGHLWHPRPSFLFDPTSSRRASFLPLPHHPPFPPFHPPPSTHLCPCCASLRNQQATLLDRSHVQEVPITFRTSSASFVSPASPCSDHTKWRTYLVQLGLLFPRVLSSWVFGHWRPSC